VFGYGEETLLLVGDVVAFDFLTPANPEVSYDNRIS